MADRKQPSPAATYALLVFLVVLTVAIVFIGLVCSPYFLVVRGWPVDKIVRHYVWWYGKGYVFCTRPLIPCAIGCDGPEVFPLTAPAVVVMNHHSILDLYYLGLLPFDGDIAFVTQRRPFLIKLYAPFMSMAKYVDMRESDFDSCLEQCRVHLENGTRVLFFPEAGRSRTGALQAFRQAPFRIAVACNVPVIPFCISGTEKLLPPKARYITPTSVALHVCSPVYPSDAAGEFVHRRLAQRTHDRMKEQLRIMQCQDGNREES